MHIRNFFVLGLAVAGSLGLIACDGGKDKSDPGPKVCEFGKSGDPELCDGNDNDCDDNIDEYADLLCGVADCKATPNLNCSADGYPPFGDGWQEPNSDNSTGGIVIDKDGNITLGKAQQTFLHVWIANTVEGTVSKLDAETGKELARYPSVIEKGIATAVGTMAHDAMPYNQACGQPGYNNNTTPGNCPSRTAVDQLGNAYVANRAFMGQGTVTKIADFGTDEQKLSHCDDRNGDGVIQTSTDLDGNGAIDPNSDEWVGTKDECILWTRNVGSGLHGVPRALAVGLNRDGAPGFVWVGLNGGDGGDLGAREIVALDPETGLLAKRGDNSEILFNTGTFKPYGAVTGRDGRIWFTQTADGTKPLGYVAADATTFTLINKATPDGKKPYGISADRDGNIYLGSFNSAAAIAYRFNPGTEEFTAVAGAAFEQGRGVAVDEQYLWVAVSTNVQPDPSQRVLQYKLSDLSLVKDHSAIKCNKPIGMGVSANGNIWAVCYGTANARGFAAFYDGKNWAEPQEVGVNPYTYSDFTGFNLNFIAENGAFSFEARGCPGSQRTQWDGFVISAGEIPLEATVTVRVRVASTTDGLKEAKYSEAITVPQIGQVIYFDPKPQGAFLQMQVSLSTGNPETPPKIKDIQLVKSCFVDVP
ncbi:MAG: hypothetical protein H6715_06375 [Myxococcales bacterium]|nr:hypothetical protein [Myxococcales bacterium]MCB9709201.1 hypothetical protein [Myxococcales bacterium]